VHDSAQSIDACLSPNPFDRLRASLKLAGCEQIQSVHLAALPMCLAKALHAAQSSEVDVELGVDTRETFGWMLFWSCR
jgi:hypothetical protein